MYDIIECQEKCEENNLTPFRDDMLYFGDTDLDLDGVPDEIIGTEGGDIIII